MRALVLALLLAVTVAGCTSSGGDTPAPAAGEDLGHEEDASFPVRYHLNATLAAPVTHYNVVRAGFSPLTASRETVLDNGSTTWTWSNSNGCGRFETLGSRAIWHHGDDTNCDHSSPSHPGKVTVIMGNLPNSTASTGYGTCEYEQGSNTGRSPACFVSSVAPDGAEPARRTSLPASIPALLVGALVAALVLASRRR